MRKELNGNVLVRSVRVSRVIVGRYSSRRFGAKTEFVGVHSSDDGLRGDDGALISEKLSSATCIEYSLHPHMLRSYKDAKLTYI